METFSPEYLKNLQDEHKFTRATITELSSGKHIRMYVNDNGVGAVDSALAILQAKKVELEAKINVLNEFLNG